MAEITHRVAGEETEQKEGVNDNNIEFVLTAIFQSSPQKSVKYHLYWSEIVKKPYFLENIL